MSEERVAVRRALLSTADKSGLIDLARGLSELDVALVSTGGTARALREAGLPVTDVSEVTGHPEVMGGRVKTLHPRVHGGLLARLPQDAQELQELGIEVFDLVVVNLYPFEAAAEAGSDLDTLVEEIDIGGPSMLRAAAKNFSRVTVLSAPGQYTDLLAELREHGGVSAETRRRLALAAFSRTLAYDQAIVDTLSQRLQGQDELPQRFVLSGERIGAPLRYGENPQQRGALYNIRGQGLGGLRVLGEGKELSYNNLLDVDAALSLAHALPHPGVCVIKHASPCGAASAADLPSALEAAWEGDPLSAFGSVVGLNTPLTLETAESLVQKPFVEAVVAPSFSEEAVGRIRARKGWGKSVRLVEAVPPPQAGFEVRSLAGAFLLQDRDTREPSTWEVVTERAPSKEEDAALRFAWSCVRYVRSNAIVLASGTQLIGVGGGQPSRVDAVGIAASKAGPRARGSVLASDAFFPFPDGIEVAHESGVSAVVQPGGSKKDADVIARANELGISMVFTGTRTFRH